MMVTGGKGDRRGSDDSRGSHLGVQPRDGKVREREGERERKDAGRV